MPLTESQLETWTNQGAVKSSSDTHTTVRTAIEQLNWQGREPEIYLQGSYKNSTNIRGDSDVDIVVQLNSTFYSDISGLSESEKSLYGTAFSNSDYTWSSFRNDVLSALRAYFGYGAIEEGNKSIKVLGSQGRLPVDVVVALQYRKYEKFQSIEDQKFIEGMKFQSMKDQRWIVNFPKVHYTNGIWKNSDYKTSGSYKPVVRMFKNARSYMVDKGIIQKELAPSYFVESLLYNVDDSSFEGSRTEIYIKVLKWILDSLSTDKIGYLLCQNEQLPLFGDTPEQWNADDAFQLAKSYIELME